MHPIDPETLIQGKHPHPAIFFTPDGVIAEADTAVFLLPFLKTIETLNLTFKQAHLDNELLIVNCLQTPSEEKTHANGYQIYLPRQLLTQQTAKSLQKQFLRSLHWVTWDQRTQYCSVCGGKVHQVLHRTEKKCEKCDQSFFPKLSPAVMVLIRRNEQLLLGRSPHFKPGIYSALAGFIDLGESAEEAIHREVKEEVGVEITDLRYFCTQSWPFTDGFMIAFHAQYVQGDIQIDPVELEDAQWFDLKKLPPIPDYPSVARQLIEHLFKTKKFSK